MFTTIKDYYEKRIEEEKDLASHWRQENERLSRYVNCLPEVPAIDDSADCQAIAEYFRGLLQHEEQSVAALRRLHDSLNVQRVLRENAKREQPAESAVNPTKSASDVAGVRVKEEAIWATPISPEPLPVLDWSMSESDAMTEDEEPHSTTLNEAATKTPSKIRQRIKRVCEECGTTHEGNAAYSKHMLEQHQIKNPFRCEQCPKRFTRLSGVNQHIRAVHLGERNFYCLHCGKGFFNRWNFKLHLRVHNGEKPFQCKNCMKRFRRRHALNKHNRHDHCQ